MTIENFIECFGDILDDTEVSEIKPSTNFKELEEWSSLTALSIIAMADEEYDATLNSEDIRNAKTIEDLFNTIQAKINS